MKKTKEVKGKKVFDEQYFTDYYFAMTGTFQQKDLIRNKNWFYGWFNALQSLYDFKRGDGKKALEIGCSIGAAADILHERGFDVTATDISPYAVKNAKKLLPDITFDLLDVDTPPKKSLVGKFDVIFSFEVIEHLPNPQKSLINMTSMLKKGGVLINSTPYPYDYVYFDKTHISVNYPDAWVKMYKKAGLSDVKYIQRGFVPFFYRYSKYFHITLPFGLDTRYINSPVFIYGKKK